MFHATDGAIKRAICVHCATIGIAQQYSFPWSGIVSLLQADAPQAYKIFNDKSDNCIKVVMDPRRK
jgi:threonine dehydrogenase-like Zn-dependent dehydrogenase